MKKLIVFFVIVSIFISACTIADKRKIYVDFGHGSIFGVSGYYCRSIDEENRIAYDCAFSSRGDTYLDEYHLSQTNSWGIEK